MTALITSELAVLACVGMCGQAGLSSCYGVYIHHGVAVGWVVGCALLQPPASGCSEGLQLAPAFSVAPWE